MRIIGLDLGTHSVKAVEFDSGFGRFEIHEYHEVKVKEGQTPAQAAHDLIAQLDRAPDKIAVSLRPDQTTLRNIHFPTRDKKSIQESLAFELDDELPFGIDDTAYDYAILRQSATGSDLHVAATLKKTLTQFIGELFEGGIDADLITSETWAYRTLLNRVLKEKFGEQIGKEDEPPTLLLQVGHTNTTLYLHHREAPVLAKEMRWGGNDFTSAISKVYGLSREKAEVTKHDHAFLLSEAEKQNATPDQITFSETLRAPFEDLIREIRHLNLACKKATKMRIGRIFVCGGGSLIPGFAAAIGEIFQLPVESLRALTALSPSGPDYSEHSDAVFSLAAGSALCLLGSERTVAINFRKGEFAKAGAARAINTEALRAPIIGATAVVFCFFLSLTVNQYVYSQRLVETNDQLRRSIRGFFPGGLSESALKTYIASPSLLKSTIQKEISKEREIQRLYADNPHSPYLFLRDLSKSIPKDLVMDLVHFNVGSAPEAPFAAESPQTATLEVILKKPESAQALQRILETKIAELKASKPESVAKQIKVTFTGKAGGTN